MSDDNNWRAGPLVIERKTNLTAIAALLISLVTFVITISDHLRGSRIEVAFPSQMATYTMRCFKNDVGYSFLNFAVPVRIVNSSSGNYTVNIESPIITINIFGKEYKYRYQRVVQYTQIPGRNPGDFCNRDEAKSVGDFDFYLNGLGIKNMPLESHPLLEKGKTWERTLLLSPLYIEDCIDINCERRNYINADDFRKRIEENLKAKEPIDFDISIRIRYDIDNRGLLYLIWNLFDSEMECKQKFDFDRPATQSVFLERGYVTRGLTCEYV
ncbi:MAG: hypothetical protein M9939_18555 [Mesorhizobium sp.]|nr:hypothetical protein [Mesorhizobium sp.]MCO5163140.1 hypothetical protein [Mesorhizobium sp.]